MGSRGEGGLSGEVKEKAVSFVFTPVQVAGELEGVRGFFLGGNFGFR